MYNTLYSIAVGGGKCVISHNDVTIGCAFIDVTAADCSALSISFSYLAGGRVVCYTLLWMVCKVCVIIIQYENSCAIIDGWSNSLWIWCNEIDTMI